MGDAEVSIHARNLAVALVARTPANQLGQKIQQIVNNHEPQGERDQKPIRAANPLDDWVGGPRGGLHMNRADNKMISCPSMTTSAGFWKIDRIHSRTRIARFKDVVHAIDRKSTRLNS